MSRKKIALIRPCVCGHDAIEHDIAPRDDLPEPGGKGNCERCDCPSYDPKPKRWITHWDTVMLDPNNVELGLKYSEMDEPR